MLRFLTYQKNTLHYYFFHRYRDANFIYLFINCRYTFIAYNYLMIKKKWSGNRTRVFHVRIEHFSSKPHSATRNVRLNVNLSSDSYGIIVTVNTRQSQRVQSNKIKTFESIGKIFTQKLSHNNDTQLRARVEHPLKHDREGRIFHPRSREGEKENTYPSNIEATLLPEHKLTKLRRCAPAPRKTIWEHRERERESEGTLLS